MFVATSTRTMANARPKFRNESLWKEQEEGYQYTIDRLQRSIATMQVNHAKEIQKRDAKIIAYRKFLSGEYSGVTYAQIEFRVCRLFGVSRLEIRGPRGNANTANARHCLAYWARRLLRMSYPQIGKMMNRDHTTVIHSIRKWPQIRADQGRHLRVLVES